MIPLVAKHIEDYARKHSSKMDDVMGELERYTSANIPMSQMLVGPLEAAFLRLLVASTNAKRILEVGTYTGYSSLAMAAALPDDGEVITCDIDPKAVAVAKGFHARSSHGSKIRIAVGPALDTIQSLNGPFDLVFIDADKTNYLNYFHAVLPLLRVNGLIVADNTLWSGRVTDPATQHDESTAAIHLFNQTVVEHPQCECVQLPVRDGMTLIRKVE